MRNNRRGTARMPASRLGRSHAVHVAVNSLASDGAADGRESSALVEHADLLGHRGRCCGRERKGQARRKQRLAAERENARWLTIILAESDMKIVWNAAPIIEAGKHVSAAMAVSARIEKGQHGFRIDGFQPRLTSLVARVAFWEHREV